MVAIDEEAGVRIDFDWMVWKAEDGYALYEIIGGPSYLLRLEISWFKPRPGFYYRENPPCHIIDLLCIWQNQGKHALSGPAVAVSDELRERIANDLRSAAQCLGINCEVVNGDRPIG